VQISNVPAYRVVLGPSLIEVAQSYHTTNDPLK
jgi:hypothetical protein